MGASIAFHLAKRKAGKIVVVDKGHVGQGGSERSSALIRMHYSYPPEVQLAVVSLSMFEHWADAVGGEGDFRRTGFVRIVHPGESERLKRNVAMQRGLGVKVELIDRAQLKHLEPDWAVDEVDLAAYEPDSGYGDGAGAANDFLARARDLRVMYLSKTESSLRIEAERVCIDSVTATYFRSDAQDKFLVGDFYGRRGADPDNFPQRAAHHELEEIIERACHRVPKLENAEVMRGATGVYDMTPDWRPLLGEIGALGDCMSAPAFPA
jgi:glycine/D-amino acid oxidase-like deaminating enzyme